MEYLQLSQDELKLLLGIINKLFMQGGLGIGDAMVITPLAKKIDEKMIKEATIPSSSQTEGTSGTNLPKADLDTKVDPKLN